MADDFFELYRRPEWQKKRLEVMQAADFSCEECGDKSTTLNVHHRHYTKGAKPWEYDNRSLACLCEPCHEQRHKLVFRMRMVSGLLSASMMEQAIGYAAGLVMQEKHDVGFITDSDAECLGLSIAYDVPYEDVINSRCEIGFEHSGLIRLQNAPTGPQQGGSPSGPSKC